MKTMSVNKNKTSHILSVFLLLLAGGFSISAQGQVSLRASYPVQAAAFLRPPYSLYLSDYAGPTRDIVVLTLLNRDLQQGDVDVRLHVGIHAGSNLQLETRDQNVLPVFRLSPGVPIQIGSADLSPYFQTGNLSVSGAFDGHFPEGMLELCFTVYE
ncbi:MAG: hypothetical protein LBU22_09705, partial [Dysgonamonadaceae bacterium]|nr:hypothetical protein [Dysgonamonadaceae bacterium]